MEAFGLLGPLPFGWECKIETKLGRLYFIDHEKKNTTWEDPRLASFPTPPYHVAVQQPSAGYFEDTCGSWSSPVPSVRGGFSFHRRCSSPRLGSASRIAPSPTPSPRNKRNEQSIVLESSGARGGATSSCSELQEPPLTPANNVSRSRAGTATSQTNLGSTSVDGRSTDVTTERPPSARSFSSSSYCGVPASFLASCDTETAYRTVCSLFPTAGEPQIRHLFHKYHNRANLVLSALQVAKHPLASNVASQLELSSQKHFNDGKDGDTDTVITSIPGDSKSIGMQSPLKMNSSYGTESPARTGTPVSLLKFSNNQSSVGSLFTRWGSPQLSMSPQLNLVRTIEGSSSNKLQKSPKIKLKYLKGIFPAADETFLLDVLASCENNVQKASEKMTQKGFSKTPPPKPARHKWFEVKNLIEKRQRAINQSNMANMYNQSMGYTDFPLESPFPTPLLKPARPHITAQDKAKNKEYLTEKFPSLPERFIFWALEASNFDKGKAETLLREVGPTTPDEFKSFVVGAKLDEGKKISFADTVIEVMETTSLNNNVTDKSKGADNVDTPDSGYFELESKTRKKNFIASLFNLKPKLDTEKAYISSGYARGPNSTLAKGPNPDLITTTYVQTSGGGRSLHKGPNYSLRQGPKGAQGANASLSKGSMWAKTKNVKSNSNNKHSVFVSVEG